MTFSTALTELKNGCKVGRNGWNGKGMYIVLQKAYPDGVPINSNTAEATGMVEGSLCKFLPYIMLHIVRPPLDFLPGGIIVEHPPAFVPWVASQTDLLSDDWEFVI